MTGGGDFASALLFVTVSPMHGIVRHKAPKYLHAPDVVFFRPQAVTLPVSQTMRYFSGIGG